MTNIILGVFFKLFGEVPPVTKPFLSSTPQRDAFDEAQSRLIEVPHGMVGDGLGPDETEDGTNGR